MNFKRIKQSSAVLMLVIIGSKLIGMLRDVILANYFGTTNISDAYLIASSVPTLLFYFIGHSLATAYIPMFNKVRTEKGEKRALDYSNNMLNISLIISALIVVILLVFPGVVVKIFATGFDQTTAEIAARLIRISAPSIFLMTMVYICTGYLQANKSFLAPAAVSVPRNIAIVTSIILAASLGTDWLGWGLLASYVLEFLFLAPFVFGKGYKYRPVLKLKDEDAKQTLYIIVPILLGMCVGQVNKIIDRSIASTVVEGGISALTYASVINTAVQEVLVTGIITILFASCAELVAKGEHDKVKSRLNSTLNTMMFLLIPAVAGVLVLAKPIVKLILARGSFDETSLKLTVGALRCYIIGVLFLAIRDTLVKVFYAYKNTKVTTITSIIAILINIVLNLVLSKFMGTNGLALATSISAIFSAVSLYILLRRKIGGFGCKKSIWVAVKSIISGAIMAVVTYYSYNFMANKMSYIIALLVTVAISCIVYFVVALILRTEPIMDVYKKVRRRIKG